MSFNAVLWEGAQCSQDGDHQKPFYYCMRCDEMLCDDCWFTREKHRRKEGAHDQTIPNDAIIVHSTLKGRIGDRHFLKDAINRSRAPELRRIGDNSEWFGVRHNKEAGDFSLFEGRAYDLMVDSRRKSTSDIYPRLVSFVGKKGACCMILDSQWPVLISIRVREERVDRSVVQGVFTHSIA